MDTGFAFGEFPRSGSKGKLLAVPEQSRLILDSTSIGDLNGQLCSIPQHILRLYPPPGQIRLQKKTLHIERHLEHRDFEDPPIALFAEGIAGDGQAFGEEAGMIDLDSFLRDSSLCSNWAKASRARSDSPQSSSQNSIFWHWGSFAWLCGVVLLIPFSPSMKKACQCSHLPTLSVNSFDSLSRVWCNLT
jgi:hypothetical protein